MIKNLSKTLVSVGIAASIASFTTSSASATYNYFDIKADMGTYAPVSLGENISLNACGSTFHRADGNPESYSLCALSNLTSFTLTWKAFVGGNWAVLGSFSGANAANGLQYTQATGLGSVFTAAGTYYVALWASMASTNGSGVEVYVPLPGGGYGITGNDFDWSSDGTTNQSTSWTSIQINAAPVPEPAGILLLLPAFALIARREKRRKQIA